MSVHNRNMKHAHAIEFDQTNLLSMLWIKLKMALLFREILSGLMSNKDAEYTICEIPMAKLYTLRHSLKRKRLRSLVMSSLIYNLYIFRVTLFFAVFLFVVRNTNSKGSRWFISPVCSFLRLRSDPNCSDFTQIYFKSSLMISDEAEEFKQRWHRKWCSLEIDTRHPQTDLSHVPCYTFLYLQYSSFLIFANVGSNCRDS